MSASLPVTVSPHARRRFLERFPHLCSTDYGARSKILYDVGDALQNNRWSASKPAWALASRKRAPAMRYVWPADRSRCYPLVRRRSKGSEFWLVATVLARPTDEEMEANRAYEKMGGGRMKPASRRGAR